MKLLFRKFTLYCFSQFFSVFSRILEREKIIRIKKQILANFKKLY